MQTPPSPHARVSKDRTRPRERRVLARCLGQVQGGMLGLHGVVLAGFACLASRKAGVVDGRGRGLSPPPKKKRLPVARVY